MPSLYRGLNYPGSSGYGARADGSYGPVNTPPPAIADPLDYGVMGPSGKVVSLRTGQPWNGVEPRTGKHYAAGVESGAASGSVQVPGTNQSINPNDPTQRYRPVDIIKSPSVAGAESDLMTQFRKNADSAMQDFGTHLNNFRSDVSGARAAAANANNITPTVNALGGALRGYEGNLDQSNAAYRQALAEQAANERGVVAQANNLLPMYDTALNNIEANNLAQVRRNNSLYRLGTGTPGSLGSDALSLLARESTQAALPIEQAKIGRRYENLSQFGLPVERDIAGANINYAGSYLPSIAGARYGAEQGTAQQIQALKDRVATMSIQEAMQFMQMAGVPAQVQQQVLAGQISNLGGLSQLEDQSRYRGLQDILGVNVSQPVYYNNSLPGYPNLTPRYPTNTGNPLLGGSGAPVTIGPNGVAAAGGMSTGTGTYGGIPYRPIAGAPGGGVAALPQYAPSYNTYADQVASTGGIPLDYLDYGNRYGGV